MKVNIKVKLLVFLCAFIVVFANNTKYVFANNNDYIMETKDETYMPSKVWDISFTTQLDKSTVNSKNIYVLDSDNNKIEDIQLKYEDDKKLVKVIPTKEYKQGKTYYLCMEKGLKSSKGREITNSRKLEFKIKIVDSDFFKIRNIESLSNNMINVYFTQPISGDVTLPLYYEILRNGEAFIRGNYQTMVIKTIDGTNNGISIYLKGEKLNNSDEYSLKIFGDLTSDFGCRLLNGSGQQIDFKGNDIDYENIKVLDAKALNDSVIRVNFNYAVDIDTLKQLENYTLRESNGATKSISKVIPSKNLRYVDLSVISKLKTSYEYELTVKGIKDKFNLSTLIADKHKIIWDGSQNNALHITNVVPVDNKSINVYFNNNLKAETAATSAFYKISIVEGTGLAQTAKKAYYNEEQTPNMVKIYFSKEINANAEYKVMVSPYLKDEFGSSVPNSEYYNFTGSDEKYIGTYIDDAVIIGNDYIKLNFRGEIFNGGNNLDTNNYTLECNQGDNRKILITCSDVKFVNENTLVLKFEKLSFNENYSLKVNSLTNILGESTERYSNGIGVTMGKE